MNASELRTLAGEMTAKREGLARSLAEARKNGETLISDARKALADAEAAYRASGSDPSWSAVERATSGLRRAEVDFERTTKPLQAALGEAEAAEAKAKADAVNAEVSELVAEMEPIISLEAARAVIAAKVAEIAMTEAAVGAAERNADRRARIAAVCRENGIPVPAMGSARNAFEAKRDAHEEIGDLRRATILASLGGNRYKRSGFDPASGEAFDRKLLDDATNDASDRVLGDLYALAREIAPMAPRKAALAKVERSAVGDGVTSKAQAVGGLVARAMGALTGRARRADVLPEAPQGEALDPYEGAIEPTESAEY